MSETLPTSATSQAPANPLLMAWQPPCETPPFAEIAPEHFLPAFEQAFAGGWALAILFGLDDTGAHILQAVFFAIGVFIMAAFIRAAQRVEPFTRRA